MQKWEEIPEETLRQYVAESRSFAELKEKCGYSKLGGGTNEAIKKMINFYNFDISHFTGQGWHKNEFDYNRFVDNKYLRPANALTALINLRGRQCECCKNTTWNGQLIPLEVHHKDGNRLNNQLINLMLLCPNCHALTETWRGKNINKKSGKKVSDKKLVEALKTSPSIRQALLKVGLTPKGGNYARAQELIVEYNITKFIKPEKV